MLVNWKPQATRLTEGAIAALPTVEQYGKPYSIRDTEVKGLMIAVNRRSKSYVVQADLWRGGRLVKCTRVKLGEVGGPNPPPPVNGAAGDPQREPLSLKEARRRAAETKAAIQRGEDPNAPPPARPEDLTLRKAWGSYKVTLEKRERSERTIDGYQEALDRYLADWMDRPLQQIGRERSEVDAKHTAIKKKHGPYSANGAMRALRAIYNHALSKDDHSLLPSNPISRAVKAVTFYKERPRKAAMGADELAPWWAAIRGRPSEVRRDLHLFSLLTGMRPTAAKTARVADFDAERGVLHVPRPKGGEDRAFDLPLSDFLVRLLEKRIKGNEKLYPESDFIFPAETPSGHVEEVKEINSGKMKVGRRVVKERRRVAKTGHALRHTYRTLAHQAGLSEADVKLLLNHKMHGATAGYLDRDKLMRHLREQQEKVTAFMLPRLGIPAPSRPKLKVMGGAAAK